MVQHFYILVIHRRRQSYQTLAKTQWYSCTEITQLNIYMENSTVEPIYRLQNSRFFVPQNFVFTFTPEL